jgi:prepilin-type processing-associated H-X9-DG protein
VLTAIAKPPRPAMTFLNPLAPTDYEAIMGVQPASINPHLTTPLYNSSNRFSVMYRNSTTRLADVLDGTSTTIMVVECAARPLVYRLRKAEPSLANDQGIGWVDSEGPFSFDGARGDGWAEGCGPAGGCNVAMNAKNDNEPYSFHPGGGNFLFADAHVQFVGESVDLPTFAALCTMNAGEVVGEF